MLVLLIVELLGHDLSKNVIVLRLLVASLPLLCPFLLDHLPLSLILATNTCLEPSTSLYYQIVSSICPATRAYCKTHKNLGQRS